MRSAQRFAAQAEEKTVLGSGDTAGRDGSDDSEGELLRRPKGHKSGHRQTEEAHGRGKLGYTRSSCRRHCRHLQNKLFVINIVPDLSEAPVDIRTIPGQ